MGVKQLVLSPAVVGACIAAYDEAVELLVAADPERKQLSDTVRADIAAAIVTLAEQGITDTNRMKRAALTRVRAKGEPVWFEVRLDG